MNNEQFIVSVRQIQMMTSLCTGIPLATIKGRNRDYGSTLARHIAMYLVRELNGASYPQIGLMFGGKDHSTVMHACRRIGKLIQSNAKVKEVVSTIRAKLGIASIESCMQEQGKS